MKLLFNKNDRGSEEIKNAIGFVDADLTFRNLKEDIYTATDDFITIIGQPLYENLINIYEAIEPSEIDTDFLRRAKYIIALDAYRNYAKEGDIAHTNNGRVNRIEEHQKIPFEWQIEKSNKSLERKYYKALNAFILFMDKNISAWKGTDAYKTSHELFIRNVQDFETYFHIDGSRLLMIKLSPGIRKTEIEQIIPRIGKDTYNELKQKIQDAQSNYDTKLLSLIQEALVYSSLSWGVVRMSAQLFPEGLIVLSDNARSTYTSRKTPENNASEALSQRFASDAEIAYKNIEEYIREKNRPLEIVEKVSPGFKPGDGFVDT